MCPENIYLILTLFLLLAISFLCKSKFESKMSTTSKSAKNDTITDDTVIIFHASWCGHCKKAMPEFKKASEQGNVILMDSDDPKSKALMNKYSISGFPTIIKGDGTVYKGSRTASDILEFADSKE